MKLEKLLREHFDFHQPEIKKLNGYDNFNYLIENDGKQYIFKTYGENTELLSLVHAENDVLLHLQSTPQDKYATPIPFSDGTLVKCLKIDGKMNICRMLTFLDGQLFGEATHSKKLFESLGTSLAQLDLQLRSTSNYVIKSKESEWILQHLLLNKKFVQDIPSAKDRSTISYFFQQFEENIVPLFPQLRKQIIHNDANEWNMLVTDGKISGIIDFGDLAHSFLIGELAITIAYTCYDKDDPLEWAGTILKAYHKVLPIQEIELSVLYYLVAARLCTSVCNSAHSKKINPENEYAYSSEKPIWRLINKWLTINPIAAENSFRKAVELPTEKPKTSDHLIRKRHETISPILSLSYTKPINMVRSAFQYMYDAHGNTYLDAYNNIPHVGHSHPKVVEAGQKQMAKLNTNTRYLYDELTAYAEKLLSRFPDSLNKVFFVNSGSAATDLAIRLAHAHTNHSKLMVMEHGYHGNTQIGTDISDYKFNHKKGQGQKDHVLKATIPDTYRGQHTKNDGSAGKLYAEEVLHQIKESESPIAAFISEPVVGCGGQVPLAKGYLKEVYPAIRKQGGVCISDEVQTGFGRLGDYFWGYEMHEVIPDIVIVGKPMGNGHPIGAVITTTKIAGSFEKGVEFFSSFGGNPVSCAVGLSVLNVIEEEELQKNAKEVGDYYHSLLRELQNEHECIGDVRGSGLFIGVEIVKNRETKEPDTKLANYIKNELRNRNILIGTDGPFDNVLKTKPPLCFSKENAEQVVSQLGEILRK